MVCWTFFDTFFVRPIIVPSIMLCVNEEMNWYPKRLVGPGSFIIGGKWNKESITNTTSEALPTLENRNSNLTRDIEMRNHVGGNLSPPPSLAALFAQNQNPNGSIAPYEAMSPYEEMDLE